MKTDTDTIAAARRAAEAVDRIPQHHGPGVALVGWRTAERARVIQRETHLRETVEEGQYAVVQMRCAADAIFAQMPAIAAHLDKAADRLDAHLHLLTDKETSDE